MTEALKVLPQKIWTTWNQFWFEEDRFLNLAYFRIVLCGTLFIMYVERQFDLSVHFSSKGFVPRDQALNIMPSFLTPSFGWFFWPDSLTWLAHLVLLTGLLLLTLGWGGRLLTIFVWILQIGFIQRNYSAVFGADVVAATFLFLMSGTQTCEKLTIRKNLVSREKMDALGAACYRMIQIQLCLIYGFSGMEKLKGATWWDGTAIWSVLANSQMVIADFTWMRHFPVLIGIATFITVLFELYFPVLVWFKKSRMPAIFTGVLFHTGIGVILALWSFATVMIAPYFLFLDKDSKIMKIRWHERFRFNR